MKKPRRPPKPKKPKRYSTHKKIILSGSVLRDISLDELTEKSLTKAAECLGVPKEDVSTEQIGLLGCDYSLKIYLLDREIEEEEYKKKLNLYNKKMEKYNTKMKEFEIQNELYLAYLYKENEDKLKTKLRKIENFHKKTVEREKARFLLRREKIQEELEAAANKKNEFLDNA